MFPKEADGDFIYHMEDVLEVYCQPYDPAVPRMCMDEMDKNLVKDKYPPKPAKPGQVAREDYSYEKESRTNLFIAYEPLAGKRLLKVTEHRTKKDWVHFMQEVLEEQYPDVAKVVVVMDNLNTHTSASLLAGSDGNTSRVDEAAAPGGQLVVEDFSRREPQFLWVVFEWLLQRFEKNRVHAYTLAEAQSLCKQAELYVARGKVFKVDWFWRAWVLRAYRASSEAGPART